MTFTADASNRLGGPGWLTRLRAGAWERFSAASLPTGEEDLWKYSDIADLDLDRFSPARVRGGDQAALTKAREVASRLGGHAALVVTVDGTLFHAEGSGERIDGSDGGDLIVGVAGDDPELEPLLANRDAFDDLHSAFVQDVVGVEVLPKSVVELPVVVVNFVAPGAGGDSPASFPHLRVKVGSSAEAKVVEIFTSLEGKGSPGMVVPVTELDVADNARLSYSTLQLLPTGWRQLGVQSARVGRDGNLVSFCGSLGGSVGRLRADAELAGQGGEATLVGGYMGSGDQLHDLRTIQDHIAPKTRSQLLCMGAVMDTSRSAYVGLTRVRKGAHGADAFQTNRNLVLSEGAHADSVPNLDIEENDVRCSHASTVGPIDEEQLHYLESRGIHPAVAERLIVLGFFKVLAKRAPVESAGQWFTERVAHQLDAAEEGRLAAATSGSEKEGG